MNNICAYQKCKKKCYIPSWKYCSDECGRLQTNINALKNKYKKIARDKRK